MNKKSVLLILIFSLIGCAANLSVVKKLNFTPGERVLRVAVLPFTTNDADAEEVIAKVREDITANLQEGNFEILELVDIDKYLDQNNLNSPKEVQSAFIRGQINLGLDLDADLVVQGHIIEWTKTYLALHSDIELDVELNVYDARTGKLVAKIRKGEIKSSGLSRIPTGYLSVGAAPLLGLRKSVQREVIHNLTRDISQPLIEINKKKIS